MKERHIRIGSALVCAAMLLLMEAGCASKKTKSDDGLANASTESSDLASSDAGNALGLETIHFDYDSSVLSAAAKKTAMKNASILKEHSNVSIQIEGNCDARGGIQYNLALGQRRADAVQHFLADQGISPSRLSTISYGKEKPLVNGDSDEAYAKNRRANLVITKR